MKKMKNSTKLALGFFILTVIALASVVGYTVYDQNRWKPPPLPPLPETGPLAVQSADWADAAVTHVCYNFVLDFPEGTDHLGVDSDETIETITRGLLEAMGLLPGEADACDATLTVELSGQPQAGDYRGVGACFTGGAVGGTLTLSAPDYPDVTARVYQEKAPPATTVSCDRYPGGALPDLWQAALLDGMVRLWGKPVRVYSLNVPFRGFSRPYLTDADLIPYLIAVVVTGENDEGRIEAAMTLGRLGPQAEIAVPYLLNALADEDETRVVNAVIGALSDITGQEFEGRFQWMPRTWWRWWAEQQEDA